MKKKIVFFTGSRSEYDLMSGIYNEIRNIKNYKVSLIVSGSHSSKNMGVLDKKIEENRIKINSFVKILNRFNSKKRYFKVNLRCNDKNFAYLDKLKPSGFFNWR